MKDNVITFLKTLFINAVAKLNPKNLITENVKYDVVTKNLTVFDDCYNVTNKNVYVVGAGKAVLQMAIEMHTLLKSKILAGVVCVPWGITKKHTFPQTGSIQCIEGAENNIADENSLLGARRIKELIKKIDNNSLLLVLLSGGGSALLPDPVSGITLQEKSDLIKYLSAQGADIKELNTVRKKLSNLKGGKLAMSAYPAEVVTLLITDILVGFEDMVASGPTFENRDAPDAALNIVKKYLADDKIHPSIMSALKCDQLFNTKLWNGLKVSNYVLGNNVCLVDSAVCEAKERGFISYHISHIVSGSVNDVATDYCSLVYVTCSLLTKCIEQQEALNILKSLQVVPIHPKTLKSVLNVSMGPKGVCFIAGGEPVVKVIGNGKGGRNQHLALQFSKSLNMKRSEHPVLSKYHVSMLSAGTDGMDGPTDAAGALGYDDLVNDACRHKLNIDSFLINNDSYNFFTKFRNGECHLKVGHTDTNVMDLHVILIEPRSNEALSLP